MNILRNYHNSTPFKNGAQAAKTMLGEVSHFYINPSHDIVTSLIHFFRVFCLESLNFDTQNNSGKLPISRLHVVRPCFLFFQVQSIKVKYRQT